MIIYFTPFEKFIEGVKAEDVAKDELGAEMTLATVETTPITEMFDGNLRIKIGHTIYLTREVRFEANRCNHSESYLKFQGHLGAPGIGQSWECVCREAMWKSCAGSRAIPFKELNHDDFIMSPEDVR